MDSSKDENGEAGSSKEEGVTKTKTKREIRTEDMVRSALMIIVKE